MTTTSVKDVSTVLNTMTANMSGAASRTSEASFQEVWNNQTDRQPSGEEAVNDRADTSVKRTSHQEEAMKAKETVHKEVKDAKTDETAYAQESPEEVSEETMEVINTAAGEMMQKIADVFDMTVEEVQQLMNEMNLTEVDLLNQDSLSVLILEAGQAADSMALLTDAELYADFKVLMGEQQKLLAELAGELKVPVENVGEVIADAYEQMQAEPTAMDEPVIEISVETADDMQPEATVESKDASQTENLGDASANVQNGVEAMTEEANLNQSGHGKEKQEDGDKGQLGNLLLREMRAEAFKPELQNIQNTQAFSPETREIMRQVMDYMRIQVKPDVSDLEMQLHPANLGTLQIHVSSKGGVLTANFVTQNEAVKVALESQMIQLKESFAEQGVKVEAIEVTVQTHQFESNLEQGRGSGQGETERKGRTRRINLNELTGMDDIGELSQEEALAAEIMDANGNTVDYTA